MQGCVLRSLSEIMDSSLSEELTHENFVFDVLKQIVDTMGFTWTRQPIFKCESCKKSGDDDERIRIEGCDCD